MAAIRAELAEGDHERVGLGQVLAVGSGFGGPLKPAGWADEQTDVFQDVHSRCRH